MIEEFLSEGSAHHVSQLGQSEFASKSTGKELFSGGTTSLVNFPKFSKLPPELRLLIWRAYINRETPRQIWVFQKYNESKPRGLEDTWFPARQCDREYPAVYSINHEAQSEALVANDYVKLKRRKRDRNCIMFNLRRDMVFIEAFESFDTDFFELEFEIFKKALVESAQEQTPMGQKAENSQLENPKNPTATQGLHEYQSAGSGAPSNPRPKQNPLHILRCIAVEDNLLCLNQDRPIEFSQNELDNFKTLKEFTGLELIFVFTSNKTFGPRPLVFELKERLETRMYGNHLRIRAKMKEVLERPDGTMPKVVFVKAIYDAEEQEDQDDNY